MNSRGAMFAQAARGPILLITLGSLFALQQADVVPFWKTWPLILIVIGVMMLLEKLFTPHPPPPPPGASYTGFRPTSGAGPVYPAGGPPPGGDQ